MLSPGQGVGPSPHSPAEQRYMRVSS